MGWTHAVAAHYPQGSFSSSFPLPLDMPRTKKNYASHFLTPHIVSLSFPPLPPPKKIRFSRLAQQKKSVPYVGRKVL